MSLQLCLQAQFRADMAVEMINALTGTLMTVADERVDKYLAAGHRLAVKKATETTVEKPKKATTTKKKK